MCRLLAYASALDRPLVDRALQGARPGERDGVSGSVLDGDDYDRFKSLSRVHRDGWGMAWLPGAGGVSASSDAAPPVVRHSTHRALDDPEFDALAATALGPAGLVHLRWATPGFDVVAENTHPFLHEGWAFAHNGTIPYPDRLDALLAPRWRAQRRGTTDSEGYFLHVLQWLEREGDVVTAIRAAVGDVRAACGPASLNAVLLSGSTLAVVQGYRGAPSPVADLLAPGDGPGEVPLDHLDAYFTMRYRCRDGAIVIASSGLPGSGWHDLPEDSILVVDLEALEALDGPDGPDGPDGRQGGEAQHGQHGGAAQHGQHGEHGRHRQHGRHGGRDASNDGPGPTAAIHRLDGLGSPMGLAVQGMTEATALHPSAG